MGNLPTGTLTFLFTDIEGSTRRWEHHAKAMRAAIERHDFLLRQAIERHGGYVFRTEGDAFRAAFTTAPQALEAALHAQRTLAAEPWPEEIAPIRARMALHTGAVEVRDDTYVTPALNRMARLAATAHGGQTLLSLATEQLIRDHLPPGVALRDMGEHRLKDLIRPERIFQVIAEDLPSDFPPLKTLDARPNNLPLQPTPFIGREKELAAVCELLSREDVRLVTLHGPGGTGKSRLALQAAADLIDRFSDGVFFVGLASVSDSSLVVPEIAHTLGITEGREQPLVESLKDYLRDKELLLLLDNFEQVVEAAPVISELLQTAPRLKVLVTSRAVLHLRGGKDFPVPPLDLPDRDNLPPIERLSQYEAVRLFIERARDARPDFHVTDENAPAVAEICYRLDGLPLAIELAAARVRVLTPQAMLSRLQNSLRVLTGGARDLPARQQTLRGAIEWSHDLLNEGEQQLFRRLAVFRGGATLESIEAVCDPLSSEHDQLSRLEIDVLDGISSLADKSLVRPELAGGQELEDETGEPRFLMLETIREYADEKLEESGEAEQIRRRHANFFLETFKDSDLQLLGPQQLSWIARLEAEHDNIRAALAWTLAQPPDSEDAKKGVTLAAHLGRFWMVRSYFTEGRKWLDRAIAVVQEDTFVRSRLLAAAGYLAFFQGDFKAARPMLEESVQLCRRLGEDTPIHYPLTTLAALMMATGNYDEGRVMTLEAAEHARRAGDNWTQAANLYLQGLLAYAAGDLALSDALHRESLALYRQTGDRWGIALVLQGQGTKAMEHGDYATAQAKYEECLAMYRELGDRLYIASTLTGLGHVAHLRGEQDRALALFDEAHFVYKTLGSRQGVASALIHLSMVARAQGDHDRAVQLLDEALALYQELGIKDGVMGALMSLADVERLRKNFDRAKELLNESLRIAHEMNISLPVRDIVTRLALLAQDMGQWERAARLLAAADALSQDVRQAPAHAHAQEDVDINTTRLHLGEQAFEAAWQEGRAMSLEEAVAHALSTDQQEADAKPLT